MQDRRIDRSKPADYSDFVPGVGQKPFPPRRSNAGRIVMVVVVSLAIVAIYIVETVLG